MKLESSERTAGVRGETRLPLAASLDNSLLELNLGNSEEEEKKKRMMGFEPTTFCMASGRLGSFPRGRKRAWLRQIRLLRRHASPAADPSPFQPIPGGLGCTSCQRERSTYWRASITASSLTV
jgi:hypothetical protein